MKKYLELFSNGFDETIAEKTKVENWPYVGYSESEGVKFTFIPKPQPDNEIWYTSSDGNIVTPNLDDIFGANIVSNTYENGKGIITFDSEVGSIGYYAFYNCSSLTSITIPNSVTIIEGYAFDGTGIYNDESNWENDVLYIDDCLIEAKRSISGTYTIKENTRLIADGAFYGCSLTSITIPNSITSIGYGVFSTCSSLTSITIPDSVTSIGLIAFYYCSSLTSVTIPNSVTSIGEQAFYDCSSLTSITIPNSVTSIEGYAFYNCKSLTSVLYEGTIEQWNAVTKGYRWNYNVPATYVQCTDGQVTL